MGDITYDLVTTSVSDVCKGLYAAKQTTDSINAEEFCESHIFFYMLMLVFVCMMGPFIILDVSNSEILDAVLGLILTDNVLHNTIMCSSYCW